MLDLVADARGKDVEDDLSDDKEEHSKGNVAERPAVLQRVDDEEDLHDEVDPDADSVDDVQDDKQPDRVCRSKTTPALERHERHGKGNDKHAEGAQSEQPHAQRRSILVELEADEPVDQQTRAQRARQAGLYRDKIGIHASRARRDDACVEDQTEDGEKHVDVEEGGDLFAADGSELAAHVQDHDDGHAERSQVHEVDRSFEDDGVGQLNAAGVAGRKDGGSVGDGIDGANEGAQRKRGLAAYRCEVAEAHDRRYMMWFVLCMY